MPILSLLQSPAAYHTVINDGIVIILPHIIHKIGIDYDGPD